MARKRTWMTVLALGGGLWGGAALARDPSAARDERVQARERADEPSAREERAQTRDERAAGEEGSSNAPGQVKIREERIIRTERVSEPGAATSPSTSPTNDGRPGDSPGATSGGASTGGTQDRSSDRPSERSSGALDRGSSSASDRASDDDTSRAASGALTRDEEDLIVTLHHINQSEIEKARLGRKSAETRSVREFAGKLEKDHAAADRALVKLAAKKGLDRATLDRRADALSDDDHNTLGEALGRDFDKSFTSTLSDDHAKAIRRVKDALDSTQDKDLHRMLESLLPTLERHQRQADALGDGSG